MTDIYEEMIVVSLEIAASFPPPRFYACCAKWLDLSRSLFANDEQVLRCRRSIRQELTNNFGHGMDHAEKVAVEAGALVFLEGARALPGEPSWHEAGVMVQLAGLLHDLRRGEKDHAQAGATAAVRVLEELSIPPEKRTLIVEAIANHEAFTDPHPIDSMVGRIISDALYDADKFRWGPDNFTLTLWYMLRSYQASMVRMIRRFPRGMQGIAKIKDTFRTDAGKQYGPDFIDLGLKIGEKIYAFLQERFAAELALDDKKTDGEPVR